MAYNERYFEPLVAFLQANWAPNHAVYEKRLFDWQYGGPGRDPSASLLFVDRRLEDEGRAVKGFQGVIAYPFLYQGREKNGAGLAIWIVEKKIKYPGLGILLWKAIEESFDVVYAIGVNQEVVSFYKKYGYSYYDRLNRYVAPLEAGGYRLFLANQPGPGEVESWLGSIRFPAAAPPRAIGADVLAKAYQNGVAPYFSLRPQKAAGFWEWRYLNSQGFPYLFHQGEGGLIVYRVENTHAPGDPQRHGLKCLRLIEIIPADGGVWNGAESPALAGDLLSVMAWAKGQGGVLADFQISTSRLGPVLEKAGLRLQLDSGVTEAARLFSPYRAEASPLNFTYRVKDGAGFASVDREETYFLKSDADMDRPNFLSGA